MKRIYKLDICPVVKCFVFSFFFLKFSSFLLKCFKCEIVVSYRYRMDIALFLRVSPENVFHFDGSYRPVPLQQTFVGIEVKDPAKRAAQFNKVCYDNLEAAIKEGHQVMIFVHSRGETRMAADSLLAIANERKQQALFDLKQHAGTAVAKFEPLVRKTRDVHVKRLFQYCIGVHHAGMMRSDRSLVEKMFLEGE